MEEWVSQKEYCKRYKVNPDTVKKLIHEGKLEAIMTQGGQYRIRIGGDTVSREKYEKLYSDYVELKTLLNNVRTLVGGSIWKD